MGFQVGDKVIYPNHGIGVVEAINHRVFEGTSIEFYQLRLHENNTTVNVPVAKVDEIGIRPLIQGLECERLMKLLASNFSTPPSDWKDRFKEFSDKMRTGDIFSVAEILKHLTYLSQFKPLSFREKRMLERARFLVVSELAMVSNKTEEKVTEIVESALKKACVKHEKAATTGRAAVAAV
ncbi:MAG: CarD family transcriptional regulator [Blastocatellia bacterium]|nr:CarD family transcriptional regulator [Blastocatellia bacterium]